MANANKDIIVPKLVFFVLAFAVCWVVKTLCHVGAEEIPNSNSVFYPLSPLSKDDANSRCVKFRGGGDDLQFRQPSAQRNGPGSDNDVRCGLCAGCRVRAELW